MAKSKAKDTKKNTADVGFEDQLWNAADVLRGNLDAAEYKNVVLGLIFLKYLSDRFDERYLELVAEGYGDEEDRDCYMEQNVFFVPEEARWANISQAAHTPEIGQIIDNAMRAIERENDKLKDVLPKNFARPELDKRRLGDVVDLFTNVQMTDNESEKDLLGRAYEYCLQKFASMEGKKRRRVLYTVVHRAARWLKILQPFHGRVYDPCCGSGGMFVQSAEFVRNHQGNVNNISVYGQESNPTTWKMAKMNLSIRGIDADLGPKNDDTFFNDLHRTERFDYILANPPFNMSDWGGDKLKDDPRWEYGMPPEGNANFAWMQHMIHHLSQSGRIGLVLANGSLSSQTNNEGEIRKNIVNAGLVEGIVAMPTQLFFSTQIPVCLWFLSKGRPEGSKTLFVDARNMGTMISRSQRTLTDEDIQRIASTFDAFRDGTLEEEKGFSAAVSIEDIAKQDYILTPGRYVGIADQEEDDEPFRRER